MFRKIALAAAAVMTLGAGAVSAPAPAEAQVVTVYHGGPHRGYYRDGYRPYRPYYAPRAYWGGPRFGPRCVVERRRIWDGYGWRVRHVRRCW